MTERPRRNSRQTRKALIIVAVVASVLICGGLIAFRGSPEVQSALNTLGAMAPGRSCNAQWDDDGWCYTAITMPNPKALNCDLACCTSYTRLYVPEKKYYDRRIFKNGKQVYGDRKVPRGWSMTTSYSEIERRSISTSCDNCLALHLRGIAEVMRRVPICLQKRERKSQERDERHRTMKREDIARERREDGIFQYPIGSNQQIRRDLLPAYKKGLGVNGYASPPCKKTAAQKHTDREGQETTTHLVHQKLSESPPTSGPRSYRVYAHLQVKRTCAYHGKLTWKGRK